MGRVISAAFSIVVLIFLARVIPPSMHVHKTQYSRQKLPRCMEKDNVAYILAQEGSHICSCSDIPGQPDVTEIET